MRYSELCESVEIDAENLKAFDGPVMVFTLGAPGVGKSYTCNQLLSQIPQVDVDAINLDFGDKFDPKNVAKARSEFNKRVEKHLEANTSFVRVGTGTNAHVVIKFIQRAKSLGYTTVILYIKVSEEQAIYQNRHRRLSGFHGVPLEKEGKIGKSMQDIENSFNEIIGIQELDYYIVVDNTRDISEIKSIVDASDEYKDVAWKN
jgi:predicted ABC-type ATPase